MRLRDLFRWGSNEPDYETTESTAEFELRETFTRKTVRFEFVRGGFETITYDEFDGRQSNGRKRIEGGKDIRQRGDARVEVFFEFSGHAQVGKEGDGRDDYVRLHAMETGDEVTTMNVASRHVEVEREMEVIIPCERTVRYRDDTGEQVHEGIPKRRNRDATYAAHEVQS